VKSGQKPLILVIDDNEDIIEILMRYLTVKGLKVVTALNGADGLRLAAECNPDLVLCDISLPDIDGFEIVAELRRRQIATRVIAHTGWATSLQDTVRLVKAGACDVIHKPALPDFVLNRINRALVLENTVNLNQAPLVESLVVQTNDLMAENSRLHNERAQLKRRLQGKNGGRVFIGHGRSNAWRELKDFLAERLDLEWDEFNRESVAGIPTVQRLNQMLDEASFALLVLTAEDEHAGGSVHARENVVHELGLFQGRLGFARSIVLLEEGCAEFSNIHGLTQIRFPSLRISAVFDEVRRVLERERILMPAGQAAPQQVGRKKRRASRD
jgi:DNA-binding response OmpR family regulator